MTVPRCCGNNMGYREFADDDGQMWKVWDVKPEVRVRTPPEGGIRLHNGLSQVENTPGHVTPGWEAGWLAFQCDNSSRRLRPIPNGWETTNEEKLRFFLRASVTADNPKHAAGHAEEH